MEHSIHMKVKNNPQIKLLTKERRTNLRRINSEMREGQKQKYVHFLQAHRRVDSDEVSKNCKTCPWNINNEDSKLIGVFLKNTNTQENDNKQKIRRINLCVINQQKQFKNTYTASRHISRKPTFISNKFNKQNKGKFRKASNFSIINSNLYSDSFQEEQNQNLLNVDYETWNLQLNKICKNITQLNNQGICSKKVNKIIYNYFQTKKKGLVQLFMNSYRKKKSLNDEIVYVAVKDAERLMERVISIAQVMSQKERYFLGIEISMYRNFLQQKIANRHKLELMQLQNQIHNDTKSVQMKNFARKLNQNFCANSQLLTFFPQLQRLQETHGKLNLISLKNRKRFQNLHESEQNIMKIIHK